MVNIELEKYTTQEPYEGSKYFILFDGTETTYTGDMDHAGILLNMENAYEITEETFNEMEELNIYPYTIDANNMIDATNFPESISFLIGDHKKKIIIENNKSKNNAKITAYNARVARATNAYVYNLNATERTDVLIFINEVSEWEGKGFRFEDGFTPTDFSQVSFDPETDLSASGQAGRQHVINAMIAEAGSTEALNRIECDLYNAVTSGEPVTLAEYLAEQGGA